MSHQRIARSTLVIARALLFIVLSLVSVGVAALPTLAQSGNAPTGLVDTLISGGRPQDMNSYKKPIHCLAATLATEGTAMRATFDSAAYQPERDTLTSAAVAFARRCLVRFPMTTAAPADLLDVAHLALMAGEDTAARQAADRYVAAISDPVRRRWALYALDTMYLNARPMRLELAEMAVARLDSLGAVAALPRNQAHYRLLKEAQRRFNVERIEHEGVALVTLCSQLSAEDRLETPCYGKNAAWAIFYAEIYEDSHVAIERTIQLLKRAGYRDSNQFLDVIHRIHYDVMISQIGKPVPSLVAQHWVGAPGSARAWPVPGTVSVLFRGGSLTDGGNSGDNPESLTLWQRAGKKYGDQLSITVFRATEGSFRDGPPLTPAEETARLGRYYREELGLPVTVAVEETPVTQLPPPDGRLLRGKAASFTHPFYGMGVAFVLVDRAGKLILTLPGRPEEPVLDAFLARAIKQ
jgi:hypothetical protein